MSSLMSQLFMLAKSIFNISSSVLNKFSADITYALLACTYLHDNSTLFKTNTKTIPVCCVQIPAAWDGSKAKNLNMRLSKTPPKRVRSSHHISALWKCCGKCTLQIASQCVAGKMFGNTSGVSWYPSLISYLPPFQTKQGTIWQAFSSFMVPLRSMQVEALLPTPPHPSHVSSLSNLCYELAWFQSLTMFYSCNGKRSLRRFLPISTSVLLKQYCSQFHLYFLVCPYTCCFRCSNDLPIH